MGGVKFIKKILYENIFDESVTIDQLVVKISKDDALILLSLINSIISSPNYEPTYELHFILNEWLKESDRKLKNKIRKAYIKRYELDHNGNLDFSSVLIFNKITTLRVIEVILTNPKSINREIDAKTASKALFKLYLLIGNEISKRQERVFKTFLPTHGEKSKIIRLHLFMGLTYVEPDKKTSLTQIFISQLLKFFQFEKWLRNKQVFKQLISDYLNKIGVNSWDEYFNNIFLIRIC